MTTFALATLGCKVNAYESQAYEDMMLEAGYQQVNFKEIADIYIINTCAVTNTATSKSRQKIHQAKALNPNAIIAVVGCYAQTYRDAILKNMDIDVLIGSDGKHTLVEKIQEALHGKKNTTLLSENRTLKVFENLSIARFTHQTRAYLKVQDGCNQFCSYCIIPYARGNERSIPLTEAIDLAKRLCMNGHREIVLSGIHTGRYGHDIHTNLYTLLFELCKIDQLERIRISSIEMHEVTDEIIELMKHNPKIARHLHIPIQAGSDIILKAMNRKYNLEEFKERIKQIKNEIEDISISTDVIVGFPGESEELFEQSLQTCEEIGFSFMHVFPYSKRDHTPAAMMKQQIENKIKKQRSQKMNALSKYLYDQYKVDQLNKEVEILFEKIEDGYLIGHSSNYLEVYCKGDISLLHTICKVKLMEYTNDRLYGSIL